MSIECEHGKLARCCTECEMINESIVLNTRIVALEEECNRLRAALTQHYLNTLTLAATEPPNSGEGASNA